MSKKIEDLRDILFEQLESVKNADKEDLGKEIQRASSLVSIAATIIDSSRAETEFLKVANEFNQVPSKGTGFIGDGQKALN